MMVLDWTPELPQEAWGFQKKGEERRIESRNKTGEETTYINVPYFFKNEATIRFLSMRPALHRNGAYIYRWNGLKNVAHIPYSILAECNGKWEMMALLPTIGFHKLIQRFFAEQNIAETDIYNHLWRVYKGAKEGYDTGQWGMAYLRADEWDEAKPTEDIRKPALNSPWLTVPNAMRVAETLKRDVLRKFPDQPHEEMYVREIMDRIPCTYAVAKCLYDQRKNVGLP